MFRSPSLCVTQAGTGSGYVSKSYNDVAKFDPLALTKIAASKANGSAAAKAIEPGKYTLFLSLWLQVICLVICSVDLMRVLLTRVVAI
jgi:hypothetical protein